LPKSIAGKMTLVFACVVAVWALSASSAYAEHGEGHGRGGDRHEEHGRGGWRGGHDRYRGGYGGGYGYGYAQPVYVPPPVYMPPVQSPGISLILPLNFR